MRTSWNQEPTLRPRGFWFHRGIQARELERARFLRYVDGDLRA